MRSPQPALSTAITCCPPRVPICSAASDPQSKRRRAMHVRSSWSPTRPNAAISSGGCAKCSGETMADTLQSRTGTARIARPPQEVYDFASVPANCPRWASGLARSLKNVNGEWIADAPEGQVRIRFTERNDFGILDHQVAVRPGVEIYIPMRVIANGTGSEVI